MRKKMIKQATISTDRNCNVWWDNEKGSRRSVATRAVFYLSNSPTLKKRNLDIWKQFYERNAWYTLLGRRQKLECENLGCVFPCRTVWHWRGFLRYLMYIGESHVSMLNKINEGLNEVISLMTELVHRTRDELTCSGSYNRKYFVLK